MKLMLVIVWICKVIANVRRISSIADEPKHERARIVREYVIGSHLGSDCPLQEISSVFVTRLRDGHAVSFQCEMLTKGGRAL